MNVIALIAEEKIKEAKDKGEFDDLPGKGKPLKIDDLSHVTEDLRASFIILKNAGVLPEELQLKKKLISLERLIACCYEEEEKAKLRKNWNELQLRFNMLAEKRGIKKEVLSMYEDRIHRKLSNSSGN